MIKKKLFLRKFTQKLKVRHNFVWKTENRIQSCSDMNVGHSNKLYITLNQTKQNQFCWYFYTKLLEISSTYSWLKEKNLKENSRLAWIFLAEKLVPIAIYKQWLPSLVETIWITTRKMYHALYVTY